MEPNRGPFCFSFDPGPAWKRIAFVGLYALFFVHEQLVAIGFASHWGRPASETTPHFQIVGPLLDVVVGLFFAGNLYRIVLSPVLVRLSANGIELWPVGMIPWPEIGPATIVTVSTGRSHTDYLCITVPNLAVYRRRMGLARRWLGGLVYRTTEMRYPMDMFDYPGGMILSAIESHRPKLSAP